MSEYQSRFTGEQIDEAVEKVLGIDIKDNAFVVLDSTPDTPVDLNTLILPKNYMISYYTNGAEGDPFKRRPISFYVRQLAGDVIEQTYAVGESVCSRTMLISDGTWGQWGLNSSYYEELAKILSVYPTINYNPVYFSEDNPVTAHPELSGMPYVWMQVSNKHEKP